MHIYSEQLSYTGHCDIIPVIAIYFIIKGGSLEEANRRIQRWIQYFKNEGSVAIKVQ